MASSPFTELGLAEVINASGKMTALGGSAQGADVARSMADAARHHVELDALRAKASTIIAGHTRTDAACVTSGAAAGTAIGVAAMICGADLELVQSIPHPQTPKREIILARNHDINYGAQVGQTIALGGGIPTRVDNTPDGLQQALGEQSAGVVYVQSHHVRGASLPLERVAELAHQRDVPVLVDAAAEEDLRKYTALGADLVTYSGGKAIGGPTVGFIAGRADLIRACELQGRGLARTMKVGKEQIIGLLTALARLEPDKQGQARRLRELHKGLAELARLQVSIERDLAGRDIERVAIRSDDTVWLQGLVEHLHRGNPAIYTRHHRVADGLLLLDARELKDEHVPIIIERIQAYLS